MQRGHAQVRTRSINDISAAYRRFENERIKEQRSTITVSIPVRFGIHCSISLMLPRELCTHPDSSEAGTDGHTRYGIPLLACRKS
jgi:hypothetical protein